ncbi:hypothetical protein BaRGS_00010762 [Batillaria attramentaria]|uniref:Peroxidase n=1 Tax=Batillaria attramentaria TaxID=370345 RepID=A0ABD0LEK4_9CAEN
MFVPDPATFTCPTLLLVFLFGLLILCNLLMATMKMCGFGLLHILHDGEDRLSFNADKESLSQVTLMSTHPEMCFPLATRLIDQVVETPLTGSNSSTNRAAFSGHSSGKWLLSGYFHNKNQVFRTIDGSCNTVDNRGQSLQPLARLLPPAYSDGVASPRTASVLSTSLPLPSARLVSRAVHPDIIAITDLTIFVMVWGQLMDHEMVSTPLPIVPRENENLITSFIDASTVYGSTQDKLDRLRDPQKPHLLRTTPDKFPPDNGLDDCVKRSDRDICFLAGTPNLLLVTDNLS